MLSNSLKTYSFTLNKLILNTDIQDFIKNNIKSIPTNVLLKGTNFEGVSTKEIVAQIEAKKKCETKLPTWFSTPNIFYPNKLNIEQTSSEATARYKANLLSGNRLIDLTGGLGVDCYYFSKVFKEVIHCELNPELHDITTHNFKTLNTLNISTLQGDGLSILQDSQLSYDWIYIDPSRRHDSKGKVFYLSDCLPNVPQHLDTLFQYTDQILIKASPMLDISAGIKELKFTKEIHVVALQNEVKELLFILEKNYDEDILIKTSNITKSKDYNFLFKLKDEELAITKIAAPKHYLYEPNAALLKSGAFKSISESLQIEKLHQHTHLYTSDTCIEFPGRRFSIIEVIDYNKKVLKRKFANQKLNISTRNFPESIATLKKQFKIKDGGHQYVFFTTNHQGKKIVIVCEKA